MLSLMLMTVHDSSHTKIEYIYNTFHGDMLRFAKSRLRKAGRSDCDQDAEDAVQNAFLKITKYIDSIDLGTGYNRLKSYVFSITANEVINLLSKDQISDNIDDHISELEDDFFFERMRIKDRYDDVVDAIKKLDERYAITLLYRYLEDMDIKEIATLMGVTEKTVYTRLQRGKKLLLEKLDRR